MINQRNSRISLSTLILCLCLGSLVILPFIQVNPSALEISGAETENHNLFDPAEFDDDIFGVSIVGAVIAQLDYSISGSMNLYFESASLLPVCPPPKTS